MRFLLFLAVFAIFFTSCEEKTTSYENKCNPVCDDWKICNENRTCELKPGMCSSVDECKDNADGKTECNDLHECVEPAVVTCTDNEKRCNADSVEICNATNDGWDISLECTAPAVCDEILFTCEEPAVVTCTANEKRCNADSVEICNATNDGWDISLECTAPAVCDASTFTCETPAPPECIGLSFEILEGVTNNFYEALSDEYFLSVGFHAVTPVGDYNLASNGVNNNLKTCNQCVLVYKLDDNNDTEKTFFQSEGNLNISDGSAELGESVGEITNIKLIEVTIGEEYLSVPVQNGGCIEIQTGSQWKWNTMPACELNSTRCNLDNTKIEKCTDSANNIWTEEMVCASNKECKLDSNADPIVPICELKTGACEINSKRCNENNVETCNADGMTWDRDITCTLPEFCIEEASIFTCTSHTATILEIRTAQADLAEGSEGGIYTTEGVVTALSEHGFYMQDGLNAGIFVFLGYAITPSQAIGEKVQVTATVKNYDGLLELINPLLVTDGVADTVPDFTDVDAVNIADLEVNESMLVKFLNPPFKVESVDDNHNTTFSDNNEKEFILRNSLYTDFLDPRVDKVFLKLQGVLTYEYGVYKLLPRNISDIEEKPEVVGCPNETECVDNFINSICDIDTHKCVMPIEMDVCTVEDGTECDANNNGKTTCYENACIELATSTILEIRTAEVDLAGSGTGALYKTNGIITVIKSNGFYMQDGTEAGIFVYTGNAVTQTLKDNITIIGVAKNYNTSLQLTDVLITVNSNEADLPAFIDIDAVNVADFETNESMLVNFLSSPFVVLSIENGNVNLEDSSGESIVMRNSLYNFTNPAVNTVYSELKGILGVHNDIYQLLPRFETDMVERAEIEDCTVEDGTECDVNIIYTICDEDILKCIQPIEIDDCTKDSDCVDNTNDKITCHNNFCVIPIEVEVCPIGTECINNTNDKIICIDTVCSLVPEVTDCSVGGTECDVNIINTVCNASLKCEPAPIQPTNGDFEAWETLTAPDTDNEFCTLDDQGVANDECKYNIINNICNIDTLECETVETPVNWIYGKALSVERDEVIFHGGAKSAKITRLIDGLNSANYQMDSLSIIPAIEGANYKVSAFLLDNDDNIGLKLVYAWYDSNDNRIGGTPIYGTLSTNDANWQELVENTVVAPAGTVSLKFFIRVYKEDTDVNSGATGLGVIYFDDVVVTRQ